MKRITLIRHAKTELISDNISDLERRLKKRGESDAQLIAKYLIDKIFNPDLIVSSHATRAMQTATIMAQTIGYSPANIRKEPFIYHGYTTGDFIDFVNDWDDALAEVWVVGHNPDIAQTAMKLSGKSYYDFPTCTAVVVDFACNRWSDIAVHEGHETLFITPGELRQED